MELLSLSSLKIIKERDPRFIAVRPLKVPVLCFTVVQQTDVIFKLQHTTVLADPLCKCVVHPCLQIPSAVLVVQSLLGYGRSAKGKGNKHSGAQSKPRMH